MTHADAPAPELSTPVEQGEPPSRPRPPRSTLVITAHAGDFVWRAGGAIALAAARGEKVTIACEQESDRLDDVLEFFSLDVAPSKYAPPGGPSPAPPTPPAKPPA